MWTLMLTAILSYTFQASAVRLNNSFSEVRFSKPELSFSFLREKFELF